MTFKKSKTLCLYLLAVLLLTGIAPLTFYSYTATRSDIQLIRAIKKNDLIGVRQSLASGANANCHDYFYDKFNFGEAFENWSQGKDYPQYKPTPLIVALDAQRDGPFQYHCLPENIDLIRELLDKGADINATDEDGDTPLQIAANCGRCATLKLLLEREKSHISQKNINTSLIIAIGLCHPEATTLLLKHGAEVNFQNQNGDTPLIMACETNQSEITKQLLALGANPKSKNKSGETAGSIASKYKLTDITSLLNFYDNK